MAGDLKSNISKMPFIHRSDKKYTLITNKSDDGEE